RLIEFNPAFEKLTGVSGANARGRLAREVLPSLEPWWNETFERIVRTSAAERIEFEVASTGRWYDVYIHPGRGDRFVEFFDDITERKQDQGRQEVLLQLSDALRRLTDPLEMAQTACRLLVTNLGASRAQFTAIEGEPRSEIGQVRGEYVDA